MRAATKQLALVFVALVFLCVPVHSQCALSSDVVDGYWGGDVSTLVECFDAVPFDAEARDNIHDILMNTLDLYSFTDVARANIAPYYVNVRGIGIGSFEKNQLSKLLNKKENQSNRKGKLNKIWWISHGPN